MRDRTEENRRKDAKSAAVLFIRERAEVFWGFRNCCTGSVPQSAFGAKTVGTVKPNDSSGFSFQPSAEGFGVAVELVGRAVAHKFQKQSVIPSV